LNSIFFDERCGKSGKHAGRATGLACGHLRHYHGDDVITAMMSPRPQGNLAVEPLCRLAGVSRAGYYQQWAASKPREEETAIRDKRVALANRHYGYRRVTWELSRAGIMVNPKCVAADARGPDRGVQCACHDYAAVLAALINGVVGNPNWKPGVSGNPKDDQEFGYMTK
jgi:hypothetical protein